MFILYGRDQVILNVARIVKSFDSTRPVHDAESLRGGFLAFLNDRQGQHVRQRSLDELFVLDDKAENALSGAFKKGALNDLNQADLVGEAYAPEVRRQKVALAHEALSEILSSDSEFCLVFGLVIHSVFVRPSKPAPGMLGSHGGSSSAAIGSIWLTVGEDVSKRDLMEMYVHELAHHLLFVDELSHPQFNYDAITKKENFALSAVLKRQRPLDKVVHSIVVASELLLARERFLPSHKATAIHPDTADLAADTLASIDSVESLSNIDDLVTPHLREIMSRCRLVCDAQRAARSV